jgi:hypothetical protein
LAIILGATFCLRAWGLDQPIVENYVGRQIPTAMVARNLERGSSALRPELDTGPFPNLFLVEPPIFAACSVVLQRPTGLELTASGRLISAVGIVLAVWGLYRLVRRREDAFLAFLAASALALEPVTIRYGRAFQGDSLMLGCVIAGLACCDEGTARSRHSWLVAGWLFCAAGLALKVISAYILIPLLTILARGQKRWSTVVFAASVLIPALLWYLHAAALLTESNGSRATADNLAIWTHSIIPSALFHAPTYLALGRNLLFRAFTPIGLLLALWGWRRLRNADRLWTTWGLSAAAVLLVLAAKAHHEYYWLSLAPVVAVGMASAIHDIAKRKLFGGTAAVVLCGGYVFAALYQSVSTWRTPMEWSQLESAAAVVRARVVNDALVVAPEALLFYADRRGCRLEIESRAAQRAAGEWGARISGEDPIELVEFYRERGAHYFADLEPSHDDARRRHLHEAVRARYVILVDRPDVLLAELTEPKGGDHAAQ